MNVENIFNIYFNGEPNFVTPKVYEYGFKVFGNKILLFEKSWGDGIFSDNKIYGITFLLAENNQVQRVDLSQSFGSKKEVNAYLKSINENDINQADKYGEIKGI